MVSLPFGMVYEFLLNCFSSNDFASNFDLFLKVGEHNVQGNVSLSVLHLFFAFQIFIVGEAIW